MAIGDQARAYNITARAEDKGTIDVAAWSVGKGGANTYVSGSDYGDRILLTLIHDDGTRQVIVNGKDNEKPNFPPLLVRGYCSDTFRGGGKVVDPEKKKLTGIGASTAFKIGIDCLNGIVGTKMVVRSDARVKRDESELDTDQALANVLNLKPREYGYVPEYSAGHDGRDRGFFAQELEEVLPHAVHTPSHHELSDGTVLEHFRGINYNDVLVELVAAFQALHKEHTEVVATVQALEERLEQAGRALTGPAKAPAARRRAPRKAAKRAARKPVKRTGRKKAKR